MQPAEINTNNHFLRRSNSRFAFTLPRRNMVKTLKETFDLPDPTWLQFRRRFDKLSPFCRIASRTSDEVRTILATLEQVYQFLFPQLNMRQ
jgi:hypothetical protein